MPKRPRAFPQLECQRGASKAGVVLLGCRAADQGYEGRGHNPHWLWAGQGLQRQLTVRVGRGGGVSLERCRGCCKRHSKPPPPFQLPYRVACGKGGPPSAVTLESGLPRPDCLPFVALPLRLWIAHNPTGHPLPFFSSLCPDPSPLSSVAILIAGGVRQGLEFFLLRTALRTANHQPPPTANRHQPQTANRRQPPAATNRQPPTANPPPTHGVPVGFFGKTV